MRRVLITTFVALGFLTATLPAFADDTFVVTKQAAVDQLLKVLKAEEDIHTKLDQKMINDLDALASQSLSNKTPNLEEELESGVSKISDSQNDMIENHLRIDFLNSFLSSFQAASINDLRTDSCRILKDLAHNELASTAESNSRENKTWLFEIYLCLAIKDVMEPGEKFGEFIKNFIIYSSLREPRSPTEFLKNRTYISQ